VVIFVITVYYLSYYFYKFLFSNSRSIYKFRQIFYQEIVLMAKTDVIIHDEKDNVCVVVNEISW